MDIFSNFSTDWCNNYSNMTTLQPLFSSGDFLFFFFMCIRTGWFPQVFARAPSGFGRKFTQSFSSFAIKLCTIAFVILIRWIARYWEIVVYICTCICQSQSHPEIDMAATPAAPVPASPTTPLGTTPPSLDCEFSYYPT